MDDIELWGRHYIIGVMISGICWGSLGIYAAFFGTLTQQLFVLFVLAGISLTAYVSMQSSPKTIAAFVIPTLLPITAWFFYQGKNIQLSLGILSVVFATLMLTSSRTMRNILAKSFSLGSHNTELIRKLVIARETAEQAKGDSERFNQELQEHIKERQARGGAHTFIGTTPERHIRQHAGHHIPDRYQWKNALGHSFHQATAGIHPR